MKPGEIMSTNFFLFEFFSLCNPNSNTQSNCSDGFYTNCAFNSFECKEEELQRNKMFKQRKNLSPASQSLSKMSSSNFEMKINYHKRKYFSNKF